MYVENFRRQAETRLPAVVLLHIEVCLEQIYPAALQIICSKSSDIVGMLLADWAMVLLMRRSILSAQLLHFK